MIPRNPGVGMAIPHHRTNNAERRKERRVDVRLLVLNTAAAAAIQK